MIQSSKQRSIPYCFIETEEKIEIDNTYKGG